MEQFDPYYKWLGVGANERPINHYRLLGLRLFEADADVISHAADRQMAHIRSFQTGKHAAESQKLLNELSAAQRCLLNKEQKVAYDVALRRQLAPPVPPAVLPPAIRQPPPLPPPAPALPPAARNEVRAKPELDVSAILGAGAREELLTLAARTPMSKPASAVSGGQPKPERTGLPSWLLGGGVAMGVVVIGVAIYLIFGQRPARQPAVPSQPGPSQSTPPASRSTLLTLRVPDVGLPIDLRLDDAKLDVPAGESRDFPVSAGEHRLELRRPGFQTLDQQFTIEKQQHKPIDLSDLSWTPISTLIVPIKPDQQQNLGVLLDGGKLADLSAAAFRRDARAWYLGVEPGRHEVTLVDRTGNARTLAQIVWAAPDRECTFESPWLPPGMPEGGHGLVAEYYEGRNFERLLSRRYDRNVDNFWGMDPPLPGVPATRFSARWSGYVKAPRAGRYTFVVIVDDGARFYFDGQVQPAIDAWNFGPPRTKKFAVDLDDQPHAISLDYFQSDNESAISLRWVMPGGGDWSQPVPHEALFCDLDLAKQTTVVPPQVFPPIGAAGTARGLKAEFFRDQEFKDKVVDRVDRRIDWPWAFRPPAAPDIVDNKGFSALWTGWVKAPRPGVYRWLFTADGSLKVYLDKKEPPLIEGTSNLGSRRYSAQVPLDERPHRIRVEYVNRPTAALITWRWIEPGTNAERIVSAGELWVNQPPDASTPAP